jgi:cytochrome P450
MDHPSVDLSDDQSFAHGFPHEFFTWLRKNDPVYWHEPSAITPDGEGFWVISRYADVNAIIMDPTHFSSDKAGHRTGGGTAIKDEATAGKVLNQTDDPHHKRLRELVSKGFTVKAVAEIEAALRAQMLEIVEGLEPGDEFNFCQRIAREIPTQAICMVLGVPEDDRLEICDWIDRGVEEQSESVISAEYFRKLRHYGQSLINEKRERPQNDILSTIVHAEFEADGSTLTDFELRSFFSLLFPAGAETTTRSISGGMLAFLENPQQWRRLNENPTLIKSAVEEIVRWTTPSIYKRRTATEDIEFNGTLIRAADKVTFWEMSANRDEEVFDQPFEFRIDRSPNRHIGFGAGVHFCLGAALAQLELKIVFEELIRSEIQFELTGQPQWVPNNRLLGLKSLPVKVVNIR